MKILTFFMALIVISSTFIVLSGINPQKQDQSDQNEIPNSEHTETIVSTPLSDGDGYSHNLLQPKVSNGLSSSTGPLSFVQVANVGSTELSSPFGVAIGPSGNLFVADRGNNLVRKYNPEGQLLLNIGSGILSTPEGVAVNSTGFVYVSDTGNGEVDIFDPLGSFVGQITGFSQATNIIILPTTDEIFVADYMNNIVRRFDPNGTELSSYLALGFPVDLSFGVGYNTIQILREQGSIVTYTIDGELLGEGLEGIVDPGPNRMFTDLNRGITFVADLTTSTVKYCNQTGGVTFKEWWGGHGTGNTQFQWPAGAYANDSHYLVADYGNQVVKVFFPNGTYVGSVGPTQYENPIAVAQNSSGFTFVVDYDSHFVAVFDSSDSYVGDIGQKNVPGSGDGFFQYPAAITVNSSDFLFVSDQLNNRTQVFYPNGTFCEVWGTTGSGNGELSDPQGIATNDTHVFIAERSNNRVQVFNADGTYASQWGESGTGEGQFDRPNGLALNPLTGHVYVADFGNSRIQEFDGSGAFVRSWTGGTGVSQNTFIPYYGMAMTPAGNLLVTDHNSLEVLEVFGFDGSIPIGNLGTMGYGDGEFNNPRGITMDLAFNKLYIADSSNNRIQVFKIYEMHGHITVIGDPALTNMAEEEGWEGRGQRTNPYRIENYFFNQPSPDGSLVNISLTNFFVVITNCWFEGGTNGIYLNSANGISVGQNTFQNQEDHGIYVGGSGSAVVVNNEIRNSNNYGIYVTGDSYGRYEENIIYNTTNSGIYVTGNSYYTEIINNTVTNTTDSSGVGIEVFAASDMYIESNTVRYNPYGFRLGRLTYSTIYDNTVEFSSQYGINLHTLSNSNNINTNYFANNTGGSIAIDGQVTYTTVRFNTFQEDSGVAISIDDSDFTTVRDNVFYFGSMGVVGSNGADNTTLTNNYLHRPKNYGVQFVGSGNLTVVNVTTYESQGMGISFSTISNSLVENNTLFRSGQYGIFLYGCDDITVHWNTFLYNNNNNTQAIDDQSNTFLQNFWSDLTGPDLDPLDGVVDIPYALDGVSDNTDPSPLVQPVYTTLHFLLVPSWISPPNENPLQLTESVQWSSAIDISGHEVTYSVGWTVDEGQSYTWLANYTTSTTLNWDTTIVADGPGYQLLLVYNCSEGLVGSLTSPYYTVKNYPNLYIDSPNNQSYFTGTISVQLSGDGSTYLYYIEGVDSTNNTWEVSADRTLAGGYYVLHAYATWGTGFINHTIVGFTITSPAALSISVGGALNNSVQHSGTPLTVSVLASSGLSSLFCSWDGAPNATYTSSPATTYVVVEDGLHELVVSANDSLGQWTTSRYVYTTDDSRPGVNSPADLTYEVGQLGNIIEWVVEDPHPGTYQVLRNGTVVLGPESWTNGTIDVDVDGLGVGTYLYRLDVTDQVGNQLFDDVVVEVTEVLVPEDEEAVEVSVVSPNGGETLSGTVSIQWTVNDTSQEFEYLLEVSRNGGISWARLTSVMGTGSPVSWQWDTTTVADGRSFRIRVSILSENITDLPDISNTNFAVDNDPTVDELSGQNNIVEVTDTIRVTLDLSAPTNVSIVQLTTGPPTPPQLTSTGIYLNITLSNPDALDGLWINISFDELGEVDPENVRIFFYNETTGEWQELDKTGVDYENEVVWGWTDHVTVFGAMQKEAEAPQDNLVLLVVVLVLVLGGAAGLALVLYYRVRKNQAQEPERKT